MYFPHRRFYQDERQTLGTLLVGSRTIFTIEPPWVQNQPFQSCIPEGDYWFEHVNIGTEEDPKMRVRLHDVPGRCFINMEVANYATQLHGCIGAGLGVSMASQLGQVTDSQKAYNFLTLELDRWKPPVAFRLQTRNCFA